MRLLGRRAFVAAALAALGLGAAAAPPAQEMSRIERLIRFVESQAFEVGPVERGPPLSRDVLRVVEGRERDKLRFGLGIGECDQLRERESVPGDDHRPSLDAAETVNALLGAAHFGDEIVRVDFDRVVDQPRDLDRPR